MLLLRQTTISETTSKRVHTVQCRVLGVEPEHCQAQVIRPPFSLRKHAPWHEDQRLPAIRVRNGRHPFHELDIEIPPSIVNPTQIARAVEVTCSTSLTGSDHGVARSEVDHPSKTQLYGFDIVRAPAHRLGMQHVHVHGSRLHPTAEIAAMHVGTES